MKPQDCTINAAQMNKIVCQEPTRSPLEHSLSPHSRELARFNSTGALEASSLYAALRAEVERVLDAVEVGDFAPPPTRRSDARAIRATAWNIERGRQLEEIIRVHGEAAFVGRSDVLLLTSLDYGIEQSSKRNVKREIA